MAYTKIIVIRTRLDTAVRYVLNEEKTSLEYAAEYVADDEKTGIVFEHTINCTAESAAADMAQTKRVWNKTGGVLAYHIIQSFAPGETTPEIAHEIGKKFAQELFGDRFEVIVTTHLDREHLHSHILVNSVSFRDGKKYHSSPQSYYRDIRGVSDRLCKEYGLSVIEPEKGARSQHYAAWQAERTGKHSISDTIRADIDEMIPECADMEQFLDKLRERGYLIRYKNRTHISVKPPGAGRYFRLDSLLAGYTQADIESRIRHQPQKDFRAMLREAQKSKTVPAQKYTQRKYSVRGSWEKGRKKGFRALYIRYIQIIHPRRKIADPHVRYVIRAEQWKLEKTIAQLDFMNKNHLDTIGQLENLDGHLCEQIGILSEKRATLHKKKRGADAVTIGKLKKQTDALTKKIRTLRNERRLCSAIEKNSRAIPQSLKNIREAARLMEKSTSYRSEEKTHFKEKPNLDNAR